MCTGEIRNPSSSDPPRGTGQMQGNQARQGEQEILFLTSHYDTYYLGTLWLRISDNKADSTLGTKGNAGDQKTIECHFMASPQSSNEWPRQRQRRISLGQQHNPLTLLISQNHGLLFLTNKARRGCFPQIPIGEEQKGRVHLQHNQKLRQS